MSESSKNTNGADSALVPVLISVGIGAVVSLLLLMLCALLMTFQDIPASVVKPLASLCTGAGALAAGFAAAKTIGRKGMFFGLLTGAALFAIVTAAGLIVGPASFSVFTALKLVIMLLCGAIGGVLGINLTKKRKYI